MVDTKALRHKVEESGLKYKYIAEKLGISPYTLKLKIDGVNDFLTSEVAGLCDILRIDDLYEKEEIFFTKKVD